MDNSTSIYTYWAPSSKKFIKKLPTYMWPIFALSAYVHPCVNHELTRSELKVNEIWTKNELWIN